LPRRALCLALAALSVLGGTAVAIHYARLDLTLSHYDARGHLIVARRIFDSITPGWQQIGAVWLPLPHLLNALPVQIDLLYRTGASATAISILCFALATTSLGWIVATLTGSSLAAVAGAAVFALNPNVLYLQSTPMTEPLLIGLLLLSLALLTAWTMAPVERQGVRGVSVGMAFALACLTRYEGWPVTVAALTVACWVRWRRGDAIVNAVQKIVRIGLFPAGAILGFLIFSRIVVGAWFVDDFFVPENPAQGHPYAALAEIVWGTRILSGYLLISVAGIGAVWLLVLAFRDRHRSILLLPLTLAATSAVPFAAFLDGHPYRIRYMVPLIATEALCAGAFAGFAAKRTKALASVALLLLTLFELSPLDAAAPMVVEAQWDRPNAVARAPVTRCLADGYDQTSIMASMGSLGHYMQSLSRAGFALRDFLHEGNGDIWLNALKDPRPYAGWVLIEEKAEGGDMLAHLARENPTFLAGFSRVCEGAGLALYRRDAAHRAATIKDASSTRH
jgi:hypothetical protein